MSLTVHRPGCECVACRGMRTQRQCPRCGRVGTNKDFRSGTHQTGNLTKHCKRCRDERLATGEAVLHVRGPDARPIGYGSGVNVLEEAEMQLFPTKTYHELTPAERNQAIDAAKARLKAAGEWKDKTEGPQRDSRATVEAA